MPEVDDTQKREGSLNAAIANAVVRLFREYTGRGPTSARATISGDLVSVLMKDTLSRGEQSLVRDGKGEMVLGMRRAYQNTMRADLVAAVEMLTERKVIAFMSDNHIDPDMAVESFVLAPEAAPAG